MTEYRPPYTLDTSGGISSRALRGTRIVVAASDTPKTHNTFDFVCSGTSDNLTIQKAIDSLPASGGSVELLAGTYSIGGTVNVPSDVSLFGQGESTLLTMQSGSSYREVIFLNAVSNSTVSDLKIIVDHTKTSSSYINALRALNCSHIIVERVISEGGYDPNFVKSGYLITLDGTSDSIVRRCTLSNTHQSAIGIYNLCERVLADSNHINDVNGKQYGIEIWPNTKTNSPKFCRIVNNVIRGCATGINLGGSQNIAQGNHVSGTNENDIVGGGVNISVYGQDCIVAGNVLETGTNYSIDVQLDGRAVISDNQIVLPYYSAFNVYSCDGNIISGNRISGNSYGWNYSFAGIEITSDSKYNTIQSNMVRNDDGTALWWTGVYLASATVGNFVVDNDLHEAFDASIYDAVYDAGTGNVVLGNRPNTEIDTRKAAERAQELLMLSSGRTFSWNGSRLRWPDRLIALGGGRGEHWSTHGWYGFYVPADGTTIPGYGGAPSTAVDAAGIYIPAHTALYGVPVIGSTSTDTSLALVGYTSNFIVPGHWVLIASTSESGGTLRLSTGQTIDHWRELTDFYNGATAYSTGVAGAWTPRYIKIDEIVYLQGLVNTNSTVTSIHFATLPVGYRPRDNYMGIQMTASNYGRRMDITRLGKMYFYGSPSYTSGYHSITASFPAEY